VSAEKPVAQPNQLYRNDGGTFVLVAESTLSGGDGFSSGSTWSDYDNDGDLDVFVSNQQEQNNLLYRNDGGDSFHQVNAGPVVNDGGHSYSAAWVDVDNDGFVDLFVANGGMSHAQENFLYRNLGDGTFGRITDGEIVSEPASSCGFAWGDYDDDGDQDLVMSNYQFGSSPALYRNDGEFQFTRVEGILEGGVFASSSAAWPDLDNDGDLDLVIGGVFGLANRIYLNQGGGRLERVVGDVASLEGGHSYAVTAFDVENDGDQDLMVANWGSAPAMHTNDGGADFKPVAPERLVNRIVFASSIGTADFDGDGLVDVVIGSWPNARGPEEENLVLMNRSNGGNWLSVRLTGTSSNAAAIGARIEVTEHAGATELRMTREVNAQSGWRSQGDLTQHFGLGSMSIVDVAVRWPSGQTSRLENVSANQTIEITEGS
jgi:hypothetical protein